MTLNELISRCKVELQQQNVRYVLPNIPSEIKKSIADLTRAFGGVDCSATFKTIANTRTVDSNTEGFPTDVMKTKAVFLGEDKRRLDIIQEADLHKTSSGTPTAYYLVGNKMGFDYTPVEAFDVEWNYMGFGNVISGLDDEVLPTLAQKVEDDILWDAIVFAVAETYFRRARDFQLALYYKREKLRARFRVMAGKDMMNADTAHDIPLPDYFHLVEHGSVINVKERWI